MKYYLPFLAIIGILLLGSCNRVEDVPFSGPALDISFVSSYSVAQGSPTRADQSYPAEDFEKEITSLVLLAYAKDANPDATPAIKYVFTDHECKAKRAVIPVGAAIAGAAYDFYVVANSSAKYGVLKSNLKSEPTLAVLNAMSEDTSKLHYNKGTFDLFATEKVNLNQGFAMSDKKTETILDAGAGKPTEVKIKLNRTVARVDVEASITAKFAENYPDASLNIISASIKFQPATGYILPHTEDMNGSIANMAAAADSLNQANYSTTPTAGGKFRYYIYPCAERNATGLDFSAGVDKYNPALHKHPLLTIRAVFSYKADPKNQKIIYYKIPITGTDKKGTFLRNNLYQVQVKINGVTEQEVKTTIEIADWQGVVTQTVDIGG